MSQKKEAFKNKLAQLEGGDELAREFESFWPPGTPTQPGPVGDPPKPDPEEEDPIG